MAGRFTGGSHPRGSPGPRPRVHPGTWWPGSPTGSQGWFVWASGPRQRFFGTVQRGGLGRRGGACKAGGGRPTGCSPSRSTPGARSRVHPGPWWPGGPPGRRAPATPAPPGTRAGPGGLSLKRGRGVVGAGGSDGATTCPPPPIRLRPEPRDPPRGAPVWA